ncbi:MAG: FAD-dependent oxidoreductase [Candidatus Marinamargulisbacteria bacterium]
MKIAIIGAGIAGVTCAYECEKKGHEVTLFDKSRGVSGRSTTKRWDTVSGIGIDMGVPYIEKHDISAKTQPLMDELIDQGQLIPWSFKRQENNDLIPIDAFIGVKKMNGIARYLAGGIEIVSQSKITAINHLNGVWSLTTDEDTFTGFDWLVLAIPAPQIALLDGCPADIASKAATINYCAVNTMLFEMQSPLWFSDADEDVINGPIINRVIADHRKPNRESRRHTYAMHSQHGWATKMFDDIQPAEVTVKMMTSMLSHYNRGDQLVVDHRLHRWKYAYLEGPLETLRCNYYQSIDAPNIAACGDWCQGPTFINAIESGLSLAHNI